MMTRNICFVCGSVGAETVLYIKQREKGAFFPFLEHHDPPKGSRLPGVDGSVDSCRVCYAFLTQQWDSYEHSKTPTIKRLYWLKRADNGHFTGAEMRLQGEYIAQVMGLQYQPGAPVFDGANSPPSMQYGDESPPLPLESACNQRLSYSQDSIRMFNAQQGVEIISNNKPTFNANSGGNGSEGVLDLSVTRKAWTKESVQKSEKFDLKKSADKKIKIERFVCFTCGQELPASDCKLVNAVQQTNKEPFFPFLKNCTPPKGAMPVTQNAQVCAPCRTSLYQQWQAYEMSGIPLQSRSYRLSEDMAVHFRSGKLNAENVKQKESRSSSHESATRVCYLCGILNPENLIKNLDTVPPKVSGPFAMFFPFVRELRRPHGAQPLKSDGTVLVCVTCLDHLKHQWEVQEVQGVPLYHRTYSLQFLETISKKQDDRKSVDSFDVSQPLNIQISAPSPDVSKSSIPTQSVPRTSQGLLAIAAPVMPLTSSEPTGSHSLRSPSPASVHSQTSRVNAEVRRLSVESSSTKASISMPHPLQHVTAVPKKVCFLCGEKCILAKSHILCSYPTRHEPKVPNTQIVPFFPFLANRDPAPGADPMTDDGTVSSCNFCYALLQKQYGEYEESKNQCDSNRWLRKYVLSDYTCYVCGTSTVRKNMQSLEVIKFSFLKDHNFAPSALVLDDENIAVCRSCYYSLTHQYSEYERMGVPAEMRKYNWINHGQLAVTDDSNDEISNQGEETERRKSGSIKTEDEKCEIDSSIPHSGSPSDAGVPQGSKLPPLTMMSPASAKLPRNTATVPPLNQVSPSNGVTSSSANAALIATQSSSFAARLRKLANQAMDSPEEAASKPVSNVSPRTSTPKRGPPPLVYSSHSTATLTSPPVVTIAPTQTHPSTVSSDSRQGLERSHSVHSTSSHYEPVNLKSERDQRSHSTHSREEERDRLLGKENVINQSSRRMTPHSTPGSVSPLISASREDAHMRGFQPYRSGEELRHPVPPAFTIDPSAYPYPAFIPPHAFSSAFRLDDQLMLERYRMMPPPYMPVSHPGMLPHPGIHPLLAGGRYPPELLHQFQFPGQSGCLPEHMSPVALERQRYEEERQKELEREKERDREREKEREKEREREAALRRQKERERIYEKEREYERQQAHDRVQRERDKGRSREGHADRRMEEQNSGASDLSRHGDVSEDGVAAKFGSITQGTPRDSGYGERHRDSGYGERLQMQDSHYNGRWEDYKQLSQESKNKHSHELHKAQRKEQYRIDHERRYSNANRESSHSNPPPLIPPKYEGRDLKPTKPLDNSLFRPFDNKGLANGVHNAHCVDYSRTQSEKKTCDRNLSQLPYSTSDIVKKEQMDAFPKTASDSHSVPPISDPGLKIPDRSKVELSVPQVHRNHLLQQTDSVERFKKEMISKAKNDMIPNHKQNMSLVFPFGDNFRQRLESQVQHVVSKLDLDEKHLQEERAKGIYCSDTDIDDEEEMEEKRKAKLLLITSGPPMKLNTSRKKMKFLMNLELTSQSIKKDIQYERIRARRKSQRERSTSPIEVEENVSPPLEIPNPIPAEELCKEPEYKPKCGFLCHLDLEAVQGERRKELEQIRQICQKDKCRRERSLSLREDSPSPTDKAMKNTGHGVKRKLSVESDSAETSTKHLKQSTRGPEQKYSILGTQYQSHGKRTLLFPDNHNRQLSREFAQEFHDSVLQTTRQKELANRLGPSKAKSGDEQPKSGTVDHMLIRPASSHGNHPSSSRSSIMGENSMLQWPGIDGVLESYQQYLSGLRLEKQILLDRCRRLKSDNKDLNKTAENLNHQMTELCEKKRNSEEERSKNQAAIDRLKQCLKRLQ